MTNIKNFSNMKKIFNIAALALLVACVASCGKDTEGVTGITYYPTITLTGDTTILKLGETYKEPGVKAVLNGEDITDKLTITDNIDNTVPGVYEVSYSAVNADGFSSATKRVVVVANPGKFDNVYYSKAKYGSNEFLDLFPIIIYDNGDGTYSINDIMGGYYSLGRYPGYEAYGYDFWAEADLTLDGSNIILNSVGSWQFGKYPVNITSGTFNESDGSVVLVLDFDGDPFYVTLRPVA